LQVHVAASGGNATHVNASSNVIGVLKALGNYGIFLQALQVGLTMLLPASLAQFLLYLWCNATHIDASSKHNSRGCREPKTTRLGLHLALEASSADMCCTLLALPQAAHALSNCRLTAAACQTLQ
jgi:hypothetical protein